MGTGRTQLQRSEGPELVLEPARIHAMTYRYTPRTTPLARPPARRRRWL